VEPQRQLRFRHVKRLTQEALKNATMLISELEKIRQFFPFDPSAQ
jgi:hypothetical protein